MKVRANSVYVYEPVFMDLLSTNNFHKGDRVRVVNLFGCPKANTMNQCYIVPADAVKDDRGNWGADFAMVCCNSLTKPS